jgi:succinate-semialdehyde dehydrogenase / glutarate-semialdehyde dehydrogenase
VAIGPLIDDRAVAKADRLVRDAVDRGATVHTGGAPIDGPGTFYAPTVVTGVVPGSEILTEEIFGPVLAIRTFSTDDEAIAAANDTEFGLVAYAFTESLARGQRLMERLETGMLGLNTGVVSNASAPFGGVKQSGLGREGGGEGIAEYLETMYTMTPDPFRG